MQKVTSEEWQAQVAKVVAAINEVTRTGCENIRAMANAIEAQSAYNLAHFELTRQVEFIKRMDIKYPAQTE